MNSRYTALPVLALLLKLAGYILIVVAKVTFIYHLFVGITGIEGFFRGHIIMPLLAMFFSVLQGILYIAAGEVITVVMDIEENTRRTADANGAAPKTEATVFKG